MIAPYMYVNSKSLFETTTRTSDFHIKFLVCFVYFRPHLPRRICFRKADIGFYKDFIYPSIISYGKLPNTNKYGVSMHYSLW